MSNMKHKPVAQRASRRNRYVAAMRMIREKFGMTTAQAADHVFKIIAENDRLKERVEELSHKSSQLEIERDNLERLLATANQRIEKLTNEWGELVAANIKLREEIRDLREAKAEIQGERDELHDKLKGG